MANQYTNKVVINGVTKIDLTGDTVSAETLARGTTAHTKSGEVITGTMDGRKPEQQKNVSPSENTQQVLPDEGYALSAVNVGSISSTYVGSAITRQGTKTITPTTSQQIAVSSGKYLTGDIIVAAVPEYDGSVI